MDNIKKFEDFLDRMQGLLDKAKKQGHIIVRVEDLENAFPELKESEDERIRKALIRFHKSTIDVDGIKGDDVLAWLEKQGEERKITHEEICKSYGIPDIGEFSDGYHTFNGLYKQRMILFAVLVKTYKDRAWKSWKHEDGLDCFDGGWFIVGIDTPAGTYTYHYEAKDWDRFDCQVLEKAKHWDGHDEFDVERLFSLVSNANKNKKTSYTTIVETGDGGINALVTKELPTNGCDDEQKPTWSKKDEKNTWKPSDEQMKALHDLNLTGNISYAGQGQELINLYNDLNKLKE